MTDDVYRLVPTKYDENLNPSSSSCLSHEDCKVRAMGVWPARTIVPVIFVPGIMGTNLKNVKTKKEAWTPPNGSIAGLQEGNTRRKQTPADRETSFWPDNCVVNEVNKPIEVPHGYNALDKEEAIRRHWGELHADSYLNILLYLEENLNEPYTDVRQEDNPPIRQEWLHAITPIERGKAHWNPKSPLTDAEFKKAIGSVYFAVHACGYNWLQSNWNSAETLKKRIDEIDARLKKHTSQENPYFSYGGKMIILTHSMGGLVTRGALQRYPELKDKILGVVHSVQPVTGAPIVYRRFKAGTEVGGMFDLTGAVTSAIVGWSAAEITALMANAPGPMELLPTKHYQPGWLKFTDGDKVITLPKSDPYTEIYTVKSTDKWWGLVDPKLIDPANMYNPPKNNDGQNSDAPDNPPVDPYDGGFLIKLKAASFYHDSVGLTCHPTTYANYGDDIGQTSAEKVVWRTTQDITAMSEDDILNAKSISTSLSKGTTEIEVNGKKITFKPDGKSGSGDGTVPTESGAAVGQLDNIKDVFGMPGFDHQHSYDNELVRHTVLYSVAKIAQKIQLNEDGTWKSAS